MKKAPEVDKNRKSRYTEYGIEKMCGRWKFVLKGWKESNWPPQEDKDKVTLATIANHFYSFFLGRFKAALSVQNI